jgi:hypothetical protein
VGLFPANFGEKGSKVPFYQFCEIKIGVTLYEVKPTTPPPTAGDDYSSFNFILIYRGKKNSIHPP